MTVNFKTVQAQNFSLAGSGVVTGATTITLKSFKGIDGALLTMSDFGQIGFATIEPGNGTQEEQISFTGVTQNSNGTATLTGVKTVIFISPYTATSGTAKTHPGSAIFIITNTSGFYDQFAMKANDETITGQWTFTNFPITPSNSDASLTVKGVTKITPAPDVANNPVAVGANSYVSYAVDSSGTDSYVITPSPAITAYTAGQEFTFKVATANTGACTLNVNGLGAKSIYKNVNSELATGDILANQIVVVKYDGTNMQLVSRTSSIPVTSLYTSSGTWTKPAGLKYIIVELVGGGGNGGNASGTSVGNKAGLGGGGAGYSKKTISVASLGATETITVGGSQGTSSFGSHLSASGGSAQVAGVGSNGDLNLYGSDGGNIIYQSTGTYNNELPGFGGGSFFSGILKTLASSSGNGITGKLYGGGGTGAVASASDFNTYTGGVGAAGLVIVTEYY